MKSLTLSSKLVASAFLVLLFTGNAAAQSEFNFFHTDHILLYIVGIIFILAFVVVKVFRRMEKNSQNTYSNKRPITSRRRRGLRPDMISAGMAKK